MARDSDLQVWPFVVVAVSVVVAHAIGVIILASVLNDNKQFMKQGARMAGALMGVE